MSAVNQQLASALNNQANALHAKGQSLAALELFDQALLLDPDFVEAHSNRGNALRRLKRYGEAIASYRRAIALKDDYGPAHNNMGIAWQELNDYDTALACHDRALAINPSNSFAHNNRARALRAVLRLREALESYEQAIACKPDFTEAIWNKAIVLLMLGEYEQGWALYESRRLVDEAFGKAESFGAPDWRGREPLGGKTLLLYNEQGLGDSIQFCRYAPLLADRGAEVLLRVQKPLAPLMAQLNGVSQVFTPDDPLPAIDFQCPLTSLPYSLGTRLDTVPAQTPYLQATPLASAKWEGYFQAHKKPRIGLVWRGNPLHTNDHNRSIALAQLVTALGESSDWFSLQKDVSAAEHAMLKQHGIKELGAELHSFDDTAAICSHLDMVVSVDTSVAHLAGALGTPTLMLLPYSPDYRWMVDRTDTPWYPRMQLLRQTKIGQWDEPLRALSSIVNSGVNQHYAR